MTTRIELPPGVTLPPFLPTERLRYGRLTGAQVAYTFGPTADPSGLDLLTVAIWVTEGAMVVLGVSVDAEPDAIRLTLDPIGDILRLTNLVLDKTGLRTIPEYISELRAVLTKDQPLVFHFTNTTPYEIPFVINLGVSLISEEQAGELRAKRGPR